MGKNILPAEAEQETWQKNIYINRQPGSLEGHTVMNYRFKAGVLNR